VEIEILKKLFTEEEAKVAALMTPFPEIVLAYRLNESKQLQ